MLQYLFKVNASSFSLLFFLYKTETNHEHNYIVSKIVAKLLGIKEEMYNDLIMSNELLVIRT